MAKFKGLLGSLSGSVANATFSSNRGGAYLRQRVAPTNPQTLRQQAARAALTTLSSGWRALSSTQRAEWDAWAAAHPGTDRLGNTINYTGHQMYVALNARLLDAAASPIATAPTAAAPTAPLSAAVTRTTETAVAVSLSAPGAGNRVVLWQSLPVSPGASPNRAQCYCVGYSAAAPTSPVSFTLRKPFPTGSSMVFYVAVMDAAGQLSEWVQAQVNA